MDELVARSIAKWPNVPAVFGWLELDRRGGWRIRSASATQRFEKIANTALREFIGRNYECDSQGRWFFQNGPQRVYVRLAYAPLVVHYDGDALFDHCGRPFAAREVLQDEEGSVLMSGERGLALLDDRDLARFADQEASLQRINRSELEKRFGFVTDPRP